MPRVRLPFRLSPEGSLLLSSASSERRLMSQTPPCTRRKPQSVHGFSRLGSGSSEAPPAARIRFRLLGGSGCLAGF
eukprot:6391537-Alexandrium_andersonii.AAC.1